MRSLCVAVPKREGENIRLKLSGLGILRKGLRIFEKKGIIHIPVTRNPELGFMVLEAEFEEMEQTSGYKELVSLSDDLKSLLPSSFDIIGEICLLKLPEPLECHAEAIGKALLEANRNLKTVVLDRGVKGEFRTRDVKVVAGEESTVTVHREFGMNLEMDVAEVYFSPRLAGERKRVADLVSEGEIIIDMFAGVGPFSVMIAKHAIPSEIHAIDINPTAIYYLERNSASNKSSNISPHQGDARLVVCDLPDADRIIMNLPHSALDFLPAALDVLNPGGTIHLYLIAGKEELGDVKKIITGISVEAGHSLDVVSRKTVHTYSPTSAVYVFDLKSAL